MFGLFRKKQPQVQEAFNYEFVSVDMHSHVLPGIDDGAATVQDSVLLVKEMMAAGIKKIIATPHVMSDFYKNTPQTIGAALEKLQLQLKAEGIEVEIQAAAEHYYDEFFSQRIDDNDLMLINNEYVLFELSYTSRPPNVMGIVKKITAKGYIPILAHPERYPYITVAELTQLRDWGCRMQMNTISLIGYYGKVAKKAAEAMVDAGIVDFISSDMHHLRHADAFNKALQMPYLKKLKDESRLQNINLL